MIYDYFMMGLRNIQRRRLRSWLTMIGIFIGIASVVALVSLGQGLQKYIDEEFAKLGRDKIIITPKGGFGPGTSTVKLTDTDLRAIRGTPDVIEAAGLYVKPLQMEFNNEVRYYFGAGLPSDDSRRLIDELFLNYNVEVGRNIKKGDKYKVMLGHYFLDQNLFGKNVKLNDKIKINGKDFEVVGFLEIIGNPQDDTNVYMPLDTLKELSNLQETEYSEFVVKIGKGVDPVAASQRIERALRRSRGLKEGNEDFEVSTTEELMKAFNTLLNIVQGVLVGIALISLVVGGIGIMNTMYTAVLERTKEIGILKAVGAQNRDILSLFLVESGILGLAGGAIGVLLGMGFSKLVELVATMALQTKLLQAYFPWYLTLGSLAFSFLVGTVSGILPAYQASRQKPVDALRYE
jgi:putative ABC transport system permease protein